MVTEFGKLKGGGKLALALSGLLMLVSGAIALNVGITRTTTGVEFKQFAVTSADTYKHTGQAPAIGSTYTEVGYGTGNIQDSFQVTGGACLTHDVWLWVRSDWYLELNASITSGTASACVYSPEVIPCCPPGGQDNHEE